MLAKNEIDSAFDVALAIDLVAGLGKKSVLVAIETTAIIALLVGPG